MASIDKAAIVFSIAITLVGVGIAAMGGSMDNSPAAPTQQMSSATNTDAAEKAAEAAAAKAAAAEEAAAKAAERAAAADAAAAERAEAAAAKAAAAAAAEKAAAAAAAAAAGPETHIVETAMGSGAPGCETSNACYLPQDITINAGDTVTWDNVDNAAHTVTGGSPANGPSGVFDSSLLMAKGVFSHTFDDAGYYDYFCMVHPWMIGSVTVN
ncbi:MAG: plastocyanin/azurin family copper-binding protein [Marine Group I thaumarchaeote]|nr:MAG: plastocyanin/azurin family copper-binding protein [Marine Group I thaumarchaeote]